eukprot:370618-Alexandrium_andersonii.AAC.1
MAPSAARHADSYADTPGGRSATLTPVARHATSRMTGYSSSSTVSRAYPANTVAALAAPSTK